MEKRRKSKRRSKKGKRAGFGLCMALTAGILGLSACQVMVWAAPKNIREEKAVSTLRELTLSSKKETASESWMEQTIQMAAIGGAVQNAIMEKTRQGTQEEENRQPLIAIDPGHGGMDCGCAGKSAEEKDINLQIARALEKELTEKGYRVLMLREKDELIGKLDRVEIANSYQADLYVSIHQNTYEGKDKSVGGIETWYDGADTTRDNERLALLVHRETVKSTGAKGRGVINSQELYVVSKTLMPACLIETGFLSNPQEEQRLADTDYQRLLAEGIARGIELYFHPGILYIPFEEAPWRDAATAEV